MTPHPIPYQGSKRAQTSVLLTYLRGYPPRTLFEPFAGSAAVTLAAAEYRLAEHYCIGDALVPLMGIWQQVITTPEQLADQYEQLWTAQLGQEASYYQQIRDAFNVDQDPAKLLYLLTRCVKNAIRFNSDGQFNQSPDHRRKGTNPQKMRMSLLGAYRILRQQTSCFAGDYDTLLQQATPDDVVYLDPPYQGTSNGRDSRYFQSLDRERLLRSLESLNERNIPFLLSFDGRSGDRSYGEPLPARLHLHRLEIPVGRSSQATLNGWNDLTVESLYLSRHFSPTIG